MGRRQGQTNVGLGRRSRFRPRVSLRRRLSGWMLVATVGPILLVAAVQNYVLHHSVHEGPERAVALAGGTLAAALTGQLGEGWSGRADAVVDAVTVDPRVNVVMVTDARKRMLHRRAVDPTVYEYLNEYGVDESSFKLDVGRTYSFGSHGEVAVQVFPVWSALEASGDHREVEGYVLAAVFDNGPTAMAHRLSELNLMIAGGALLVVLPIVVLAVNRWMKPLGAVMSATRQLARGCEVEPVPENDRDEIGLLGKAFNVMSSRLADAHEQLRMHNEELEKLVDQRTAELEGMNQKLGLEIEEKNQFLRSVSHDLGAPLRNIDGMATLVLMKYRDELNDDVVKKLERICANVKQETELISDLTKLNELRVKHRPSDLVEVGELLEQITGALAHQFEQSGIEVKVEGLMPTLRADRNRIRQVFQNLIDNAAKYMMDSVVKRITIRVEDDLDYFGFAVEDTGRGIAWEDQGKLFGVFQRGTHSGTHEVQGRGIGLATVRSIVESYGGQIWVDSELGRGSTFHFTLSRERVSPPLEEAGVRKQGSGIRGQGSGIRG